MLTHTDEFIEHWGSVFVTLGLRELLGISFERFLECPAAHLEAAQAADEALRAQAEAVAVRLAEQVFEPLLPRQRAIAERIELAEAFARAERGRATRADRVRIVAYMRDAQARADESPLERLARREADAALHRVATGMATADDAEVLEAEIECARAVAALPRRNGAPVEALHHHRHPRNGQSDFRAHQGAAS